jgi:LacI family transcriptional regulator
MQQQPRINAFFCASDVMAIGVMKAADDLGRQVPKSVAVLGFDNIAVAEYLSPALSTIMQYPDKIGGGAVSQLLALQRGETVLPLLLNTDLVMRDSV